MPSRTRTLYINLLDRISCWCFHHSWVPDRVFWWIDRMYWNATRNVTLTAVGDDEPVETTIDVPCRWDEYGNPVSWLRFGRTHVENDTCQQGCVIHHRTGHHMKCWPLIWRGDRGIFERLCPCGVGHPDPDQGPHWEATDQDWQWVHGCCGCCRAGTVEIEESGLSKSSDWMFEDEQ